MKRIASCLLFAVSLSSPALQAQTDDDEGKATPPPAAEAPAPAPAAPKAARKPKKPDNAAPAAPAKSAKLGELPKVSCLDYLATPLDGSSFVSGDQLYFVSAHATGETARGNRSLFEVQLDALRSKRVLSINGKGSTVLVPFGSPVNVISMVDLEDGSDDCGEGKGMGRAVQWDIDQKVFPGHAMGSYALIQSRSGFRLAQVEKLSIEDLDIRNQQRRTVMTYPDLTRPLYAETLAPFNLVTYDPATRTLSRYANQKREAAQTLKLKDDMRLVQDGKKFGVLELKTPQILSLTQVKDWSGTSFKTFELALPAGVQGDQLGVVADFAQETFILLGKGSAQRHTVREAWLFKGSILARSFVAPKGQYIRAAHFGSKGQPVLLLANLSDESVEEIWTVQGDEIKPIAVLKEKEKEKEKDSKKP